MAGGRHGFVVAEHVGRHKEAERGEVKRETLV
jgi:hypothetical protein